MNLAVAAVVLTLAVPASSSPGPPVSGFVDTGTGRLYYEAAGEGLLRGPKVPALGRLGEIKVPTLLIVGAGDIPDVHAHAGAIQAGIAGSRRVVVRDAGHLVHMEQPAEFNRLVLEFLSVPPAP
jgi:pimeloyl-ACP methyl ester carboxylesterase